MITKWTQNGFEHLAVRVKTSKRNGESVIGQNTKEYSLGLLAQIPTAAWRFHEPAEDAFVRIFGSKVDEASRFRIFGKEAAVVAVDKHKQRSSPLTAWDILMMERISCDFVVRKVESSNIKRTLTRTRKRRKPSLMPFPRRIGIY
jgi:hypothetical protein